MDPTARPLIGAHVSIAGGVSKAPARGAAEGCTVIQVFTKAPGRWEAPPLEPAECRAFREACRQHRIVHAAAHDAYLINLASPQSTLRRRSLDAFLDEMERCACLGIRDLVMHPGAHMGAGEKQGLRRTAEALREALAATRGLRVRVLVETTAGSGTCLGGRFEHLAEILHRLDGSPRVGVCLDTCHVFAAGYDIRGGKGFEEVLRDFDRIVGLDRLALFHLNDSKGELGSRKDRHEHIGRGRIGEETFRRIVRARRFKGIPKIIETPGGVSGGPGDQRNLDLLFSFAK